MPLVVSPVTIANAWWEGWRTGERFHGDPAAAARSIGMSVKYAGSQREMAALTWPIESGRHRLGCWDEEYSRIIVDATLPLNERLETIAHEYCHAIDSAVFLFSRGFMAWCSLR